MPQEIRTTPALVRSATEEKTKPPTVVPFARKAEGKDARSKLTAVGTDAQINTPRQITHAVSKERLKWGKIIKESGAPAE